MDQLIKLIFEYGNQITVIIILLLMVIGFITGWIVPGPTHNRVVKERDKYLDAATQGMELAKLLTQKAAVVAVEQKGL